MDSRSKLTVTRTSETDVKDRQLIVHLDGEKIAVLRYGQSVTRDIPAGRHTLIVDNTWKKKREEFEVTPGSEARYQAINRAGRITNYMVALIGSGPMYVELERET